MLPVPPSSFYGPRTESLTLSTPSAVIDPVLLAANIRVPAPPIIHGSATSLGETGAGHPIKMHKSREEFTSRDLEHLLGAVIDINPFMAPRSKIGDRWKEVTEIVQAKWFCQNREPETLKNKVSSLLGWVEVWGGKKEKARSPLGKELDSDPAGFAALSGKLDAIQHLKIQAKDMREDQKAHAKEAQNRLRAAGEILRASMMHGHKPMATKRTRPSTPSSDGESTKENSPVDSPLDSGGEMSKRTRLTSVARLMEKNDAREDRKEQKMEEFHASLLERHDRAIDIQERMSTALLDILRQGLLNN
ncbi:hypothetical protein JB92DRAFT_2828266 [Gautieria morchelliformis]|nr:hypothetical protein JB92DRAFT_2828266 [Gautieria morchelliformis]